MSSRLGLGTVQIGLKYGIANQAGQVSRDEAAAILAYGLANGLDTLDTAIAYGDSEERLGEIGVREWRVVTKLPRIPAGCGDVGRWVSESVAASLTRLRLPKVCGVLLHRSEDLLRTHGGALYESLLSLKERGLVEKIGVSIYAPDELESIGTRFPLDLVQAPFNVIDRRLETSGWLARLSDARTEVHVRSVFLQGALLMESSARSASLNRWKQLWADWHQWLADRSLTPVEGCLAFALSYPQIDRVLVGVDHLAQLTEIISATKPPSGSAIPPIGVMSDDEDLVNPARWNAV